MKMKLALDDLEVESFATLTAPERRGTVFGNETEAETCGTCDPSCATCLDCSNETYCVCNPESTIQCGGTEGTWYYSCDQTMGVCPTNTCNSCAKMTCDC